MDCIKRLGNNAVVPVVVIENAQDAVPTAKALLAGGIDVMEITLRTSAALEAIKLVSENVPEMLVGAGTVVTLEQCKSACEAGSKFIVSPGFDQQVVEWCVDNDVSITPGCVTPTEIMAALKFDLKVIKFFPANIYGGLEAMKALAGPFGGIKFIPTGGVSLKNIGEFSASPIIHTVGGSWICTKKDISERNTDKITELCAEAVNASLGFEVAHIGINTQDEASAKVVSNKISNAFGFQAKDGSSSIFASSGIEVMKSIYLGQNGHIAIRTNNIQRAIYYLEKHGFIIDQETAKHKDGKMIAVYLKGEMGGFAMHLLQK